MAAGADGIKILAPFEGFIPKIFYFFLKAVHLPSKGYARHFQYLNSSKIPLPPFEEQRKIVEKLETIILRLETCIEKLNHVDNIVRQFRQSVLAFAVSGKLTEGWRGLSGAEYPVEAPENFHDSGSWPVKSIPKGWDWVNFKEIFDDQTDSKKKIPQKEYEPSGSIPVIDQGENLVGGYTPRLEMKSSVNPPVIIFGDHTRCVKWINTEFVQGADGVKVLVPRKKEFIAKYAYYALMACDLPDKGYSRHMKFVRSTYFPKPPIEEQIETSSVLIPYLIVQTV